MRQKYLYENQRDAFKNIQERLCERIEITFQEYRDMLFDYGCQIVSKHPLGTHLLKYEIYWKYYQYRYFFDDIKYFSERGGVDLWSYKNWKENFIRDPKIALQIFDFVIKY